MLQAKTLNKVALSLNFSDNYFINSYIGLVKILFLEEKRYSQKDFKGLIFCCFFKIIYI